MPALLRWAYAVAGRCAEARECVERLAALSAQKSVGPSFASWPQAALGDLSPAFAWLDKGHAEHSDWLAAVQVEPLLEGVHGDSRFVAMFERLRLPV